MTDSFASFNRFLTFFAEEFARPGLLADAQCRQSYKDYVPDYYRDIFGKGVSLDSPRHLRWYRRLAPLLALPPGSRILDYGGGYGMDSIFLASLGYKLCFYEITAHHIGVARWFSDRFAAAFGALPIEFCLVGVDPQPTALDAMFANEVTHHIEPAKRVFEDASKFLRPAGHFFLLEPNYLNPITQAFFLKGRGFRTTTWQVNEVTGERYLWGNEHIRPFWTWNRFAREAGFTLSERHYVASAYRGEKTAAELSKEHGVETWPVAREVLASHICFDYKKN